MRLKTKGRPWPSWFPLVVSAIVLIVFYVRNWRQLHQIALYPAQLWGVVDEEQQQQLMGSGRGNHSEAKNVSSAEVIHNVTSAVNGQPRRRRRKHEEPIKVVHVNGGGFIHMGKTGGSTLSGYLRNACHSYIPKPCGVIPNETLVSKLITDYYHVPDFFRLAHKIHSFYLISLRDPFDRTVSGFVYGHPSNANVLGVGLDMWKRRRGGYFQPTCFETLEQFVENLGDAFDDFDYPYLPIHVVQTNCTNFCRAMLGSKVKRMVHLFYNYQTIQAFMPNVTTSITHPSPWHNVTLYATRKEQLLDDFARINQLLGGDDHNSSVLSSLLLTNQQKIRDVSNLTLPVTRELSDKGRERLCRALEPEYRVYVTMLEQARNLREEHVQEALQYSRANCPNLDLLLIPKK